eukprot:40902-Pleurochrysis_carterae.AAC.2
MKVLQKRCLTCDTSCERSKGPNCNAPFSAHGKVVLSGELLQLLRKGLQKGGRCSAHAGRRRIEKDCAGGLGERRCWS